jgi:hypothetical protein
VRHAAHARPLGREGLDQLDDDPALGVGVGIGEDERQPDFVQGRQQGLGVAPGIGVVAGDRVKGDQQRRAEFLEGQAEAPVELVRRQQLDLGQVVEAETRSGSSPIWTTRSL